MKKRSWAWIGGMLGMLVVGIGLWWWFARPSPPRYSGMAWENRRTLELTDKAEQSGVFTDAEFNDLVMFATQSDTIYRGRALYALWFTKRPDQRPRALQIMIDTLRTTPELRAEAINGIAALGTEQHISLVKPYLSDPDPLVRMMAVNAIARLGGEKYRSLVESFAQDPSERVRKRVQEILDLWSKRKKRER